MSFCAADLRAVLRAHLPAGATGLVVALSGGPDSSALLVLLVQLAAAPRRDAASGRGPTPAPGLPPLRAVHVDHGLQAAAAHFREACAALCRRFEIPLKTIHAPVAVPARVSVEAAARDARYAGLAGQLEPGECLLTAHHCEDQAETFLLQSLRGAGLKGLSSMPICRPFAAGWHLRPLLQVRRAELLSLVECAGVAAVPDPMNADPRYDRVYLRREVWPRIAERWPGAALALSRTAAHEAEAQVLLDGIADDDLSRLRDGDSLSLSRLRALAPPRRINALRRWIFEAEVTPPPASRLHEALRQFLSADADQQPAVAWGGHALRRYRDRLYLTSADSPAMSRRIVWSLAFEPSAGAHAAPGDVLDLGPGLGRLSCVRRAGGLERRLLPGALVVSGRAGGEALKPGRRAATRSVQHLCQELGVLPWMRDALPFIYAGGDLIAVGDLWLDARWCAPAKDQGLAFEWAGAPKLL